MKLLFPEAEVTKSLSNIYKSYQVVQKSAQSFMIDTNDLAEQKVQQYESYLRENNEFEDKNEDGFSEGFQEGLVSEELDVLCEEPSEDVLQISKEQIEEQMAMAQAEIEAMKKSAMEELDAMQQHAYEEARKAGYQDGLTKGSAQGEAEFNSRIQAFEQQKKALEDEYAEKMQELEPMLVEKITGIYERIFKTDLREYSEMLKGIILNILQNNDGNRNYFVHLSSEDYAEVLPMKDKLLQELSATCEIEFLVDQTLSRGGCFIETSSGIYDCGIDTQLQELNCLLQVISYE